MNVIDAQYWVTCAIKDALSCIEVSDVAHSHEMRSSEKLSWSDLDAIEEALDEAKVDISWGDE